MNEVKDGLIVYDPKRDRVMVRRELLGRLYKAGLISEPTVCRR